MQEPTRQSKKRSKNKAQIGHFSPAVLADPCTAQTQKPASKPCTAWQSPSFPCKSQKERQKELEKQGANRAFFAKRARKTRRKSGIFPQRSWLTLVRHKLKSLLQNLELRGNHRAFHARANRKGKKSSKNKAQIGHFSQRSWLAPMRLELEGLAKRHRTSTIPVWQPASVECVSELENNFKT